MIWSPESEIAVIAAAMLAPDIGTELTPAHFYDPVHSRIWNAIVGLRQRDQAVDPALIRDGMGDDPGFSEFGGVTALAHLYDKATLMGAKGHVAAVADRATRRRIDALARETLAKVADTSEGTGDTVLSSLEKGAAEIAREGTSSDAWVSGGEVIRRAVATAQGRAGVIEFVAGLSDVDGLVGGFGRGELSIIAGRPGMAKSIVASQIGKANARQRKGVAFFSQEMNEEQLGLRLACDLAYDPSIPLFSAAPDAGNPTFDAARKNKLDPEQWGRLTEAAQIASTWPLMFDVRPGLTLSTIEACARRLIRSWEKAGVEPGPVIIDHLGIIRPEKDRSGNKVAEISDVSRGLAEMAKRLDLPVIALCQLNRSVEGRGEDKRPGLSDLRWSGELEQDARLVVFLYRPEYYYRPPLDEGSEDAQERAEREVKLRRVKNRLYWIVAKNNNGPLGQVETYCDVSRAVVRDARG